MRKSWNSVGLFLGIWLVTRIVFFYWFGSRLIFDEASYLYEIKLLSENAIQVFSQGPVLYYWVLPFFKLSHPIILSKLPILLADLVFLFVIYFSLRKHDEKTAGYASLFYALAPISLFVSYHVTTDVPALLFTFLSIFFFVRFHTYENKKDLAWSGVFLLLGGLTKEMDFFLYLFFPIYLLLWHWKVEKVPKRIIYALLGLIIVTFLIKAGIMAGLWTKNPARLTSMFFLPIKNGGFLNGGILYFIMVFFLFANPIIAVLGYPKIYLFLKNVYNKKVSVRKKDFLSRLRFISAVVVVFLVLFFTYFGATDIRYVYFVVPFIGLFAAEPWSRCSYKLKGALILLALVFQFALVIASEKDSQGFDALGQYIDALPMQVIYTNEPHRTSEHFVPAVVEFKTRKKLVYLPNEEIPKLSGPIVALSYNRSGLSTLDEAFQKQGVVYDKVTFVVSDCERSVYGIGQGVSLPKPSETGFSSFFQQPLRTSPEEALYRYMIYAKRNFCAVPKDQRGWFKSR